MRRKILILLIILIFAAISIAFSQPQPLPTPGYVMQQASQTYTPPQTTVQTTLQPPPKEETTYEKRSGTAYFYSGASSPIEIDKWIYPEAKNGYPLSTPIYIYVDIKSKSSFPIANIQIKEEVSPALTINNKYGYCKIDPIKECFNEINITRLSSRPGLIGKISGNNITINITRLGPKEWIRYNYTLLPQKEGVFYVDTLVRIGRNTSDFRDLFLPLKIVVEPLINEFNVMPWPSKYQAYQNEKVQINYKIQYLGNNPNKCKFLARLDSNRIDINCTDNSTGDLIFDNFNKIQDFNVTVEFKQTGIQPIPNIIIYGPSPVSGPFLFPVTGSLNIDTWFLRYKFFIDVFLEFWAILAAILIGTYDFHLKEKYGSMIGLLKKWIIVLKTSVNRRKNQ